MLRNVVLRLALPPSKGLLTSALVLAALTSPALVVAHPSHDYLPGFLMYLRRLHHFIALVEEGRFAQAAEKVHLSQAAFSRSIQALEKQLGVNLVDRSAARVTLTEEGELVLKRARQMVRDSCLLARDLDAMRRGEGELRGEVTIGAGGAASVSLLPPLLGSIVQSCPQVNVAARVGYLPDLLEQMERGVIDLCLGDPRNIVGSQHYAMKPVGRIRVGLYCRAGHPLLSGEGSVDRAAVARYGIAATTGSATTLDILSSLYGFGAGPDFPQRVQCADLTVLTRLMEEHDMVSFLPSSVVAHYARDFQPLPVPGGGVIHADIYAMWMWDRSLSPLGEHAVQVARQVVSRMEQDFPVL